MMMMMMVVVVVVMMMRIYNKIHLCCFLFVAWEVYVDNHFRRVPWPEYVDLTSKPVIIEIEIDRL